MCCSAPFPLILTFSPGEKEHVMWPAGNASTALIGLRAEFFEQRGAVLPLLGERAGVRGKNASQSLNYSLAKK
jgi:hypothetical protein